MSFPFDGLHNKWDTWTRAPSFIIKKDGDYTVAIDDHGQVRFVDKDAATVIQQAINAAPPHTTIAIKGFSVLDGDLLTKTININKIVYLDFYGSTFLVENTAIDISAEYAYNITVRNLALYPKQGFNQCLIKISGKYVRNLRLDHILGYYSYTPWSGTFLEIAPAAYCEASLFSNLEALNFDTLVLINPANGYINANVFVDVLGYVKSYGIRALSGSNTVANNWFFGCCVSGINSSGKAISLEGTNVEQQFFVGFWNDAPAADSYGVHDSASGGRNLYVGQFGYGNLRSYHPNNLLIKDIFYVTENSGTATFSGDGSTTTFQIAHGLASTPSKYGVSPLTPDADAPRTITVDDTYITITFSSAPPSGTDNIKFGWWAEI